MASTSKPKVLCLHGWRTSANIMKMQMAAFRHHVDMDYQFVDAPFPAQGPPDSGIATFYPDQSYYEWYHKDDSEEEKKEQAIKFVFKLLVEVSKQLMCVHLQKVVLFSLLHMFVFCICGFRRMGHLTAYWALVRVLEW